MTGLTKLAVVCAAIAIAGCQPTTDAHDEHPVHHKPQAPIDLDLDSSGIANGVVTVTATATPRVSGRDLEITIFTPGGGTKTDRVSRARAGVRHTFSTEVHVGIGAEIRASARIGVRPGFAPNRVAALRVGNAPIARQPVARTIALPSGEVIEEVR